MPVGNQLLILLISFEGGTSWPVVSWESVTNPLDKLYSDTIIDGQGLGISY